MESRNEFVDVDAMTRGVLKGLLEAKGVNRSYLFHMRGETLYNTHEYCSDGTKAFQEKLSKIPASSLPYFVKLLRDHKDAVVNNIKEIEAFAPKEVQEMREEEIAALALVPVPVRTGTRSVAGFVGLDYCGDQNQKREWTIDELEILRKAGQFLFIIQTLSELVTTKSVLPEIGPHYAANTPYRMNEVINLVHALHYDFSWEGNDNRIFSNKILQQLDNSAKQFLTSNVRIPRLEGGPRLVGDAKEHFRKHHYAHLQPEIWREKGITEKELNDFHTVCKNRWAEMEPDIYPYTNCRDVGYARYMYRDGKLFLLKHKPFFQTKPEYNVIVGTKPRPFNRMDDEVRESPVLMRMLQTLLEDVWSGELGPEVHIGVHPVRVRNFHEGKIHQKAHATLEGTHVDSTERVGVMMIERVNVADSSGETCLYDQSCPMGMRRDIPKQEAIIAPLRKKRIKLVKPFETITFVDGEFKHDGSPIIAKDPSKECWRSVLLIMCRRPLTVPSPIDDELIDGYTPRSPPQNRKRCKK